MHCALRLQRLRGTPHYSIRGGPTAGAAEARLCKRLPHTQVLRLFGLVGLAQTGNVGAHRGGRGGGQHVRAARHRLAAGRAVPDADGLSPAVDENSEGGKGGVRVRRLKGLLY